ncbi:MAG: nitroreductase [Proteobacteria bacterium]|nr:MAG: nitroreductase [Pseudomonadota bacterium]
MPEKIASADYKINELIAVRWSPYAFDDRPISQADILSIFESARWAPSSYNEQPWSFIAATKDMPEEYERVLSCLVEANQAWAKSAPLLAIGVVSLNFSRNGKPNRAAVHDLGLAAANLVVEATARGLYCHQMIGIDPQRARETFGIPEGHEAWTAIAVGYKGDSTKLPDELKQRDLAARHRKNINEFVFTGKWGSASKLVAGKS